VRVALLSRCRAPSEPGRLDGKLFDFGRSAGASRAATSTKSRRAGTYPAELEIVECVRPAGAAGAGADGAGVSTRRYAPSLEALPEELKLRGVGKSAVSERFVLGTTKKLAELMRCHLSGLELVALMIDGVHFADHVVLAAVGIDRRGQNTRWACGKAPPRTRRPARRCWPI
jgi:putative transposase